MPQTTLMKLTKWHYVAINSNCIQKLYNIYFIIYLNSSKFQLTHLVAPSNLTFSAKTRIINSNTKIIKIPMYYVMDVLMFPSIEKESLTREWLLRFRQSLCHQ